MGFATRFSLFASFALAVGTFPACGGGGTSLQFSSTHGGSSTSGGVVLESRSAVVATDVDGDGRTDLVAFARDGSGVGPCWRNVGRSGYVDATSAWKDAPTALAVQDDCASRGDVDLADGLACHVAPSRSPRGSAYGVVHLGDGAADASGPPVVDALEPSSGPTRSLVVVEGHGLCARAETSTVTIGGATATVLYAFADALVVVVPDGLVSGRAEVRVTRGSFESAVATFTVTEGRTPVVTETLPSRVQAGERAVIRGSDLGGPLDDVTVTFSGIAATSVLALVQALVVEVPSTAVSGSLVVTVDGRASAPVFVAVGASPSPVIDALVPAAASAGSLVRIEGRDLLRLGSKSSLTFGGVPAAIYGVGDGSLTAIVPAGAVDGDVVVRTAGSSSVGAAFTVKTRGPPHVDAISPTVAADGEIIRITGTDLVDLSSWKPDHLPPFPLFGDLKISVGGADAWFLLPSAEGIDVIVPFGAATGSVVVTVDGHASNAVAFTNR